jgi:hypothetical protein
MVDAVVHVARANVPKGIKASPHPQDPNRKVWFTPLTHVSPCKLTRYPGFLLKHLRACRGVGRTPERIPAPLGMKLVFRLGTHVKEMRREQKARAPRLTPHEINITQQHLNRERNKERHKKRRAAKLAARAKTLAIIREERRELAA